jgi:selenocysteine lyase/cysteine desulfurase
MSSHESIVRMKPASETRTPPGDLASTARPLYPITERWAYFHHAAVSPISARSAQAMQRWAADAAANACIYEAPWKSRVEQCRRQIAGLINAAPAEIAFVSNTTEGIARVVHGYRWQAGDAVIVPADEYISNLRPWTALARRQVTVRRVANRGHGLSLGEIREAVCPRTRMVALSAVHYATGWRCDLDAIGSFCRERGIDLCVDAVQAVGVVPLDVETMRISFLACGGQKWLTGPQGSGFLFVARERMDALEPSMPGWKSVVGGAEDPDAPFLDDARRFESGTGAVAEVLGLAEGVDIISQFGMEAVAAQVRRTSSYLVRGLRSLKAEIVSRRGPRRWSGIVSFRIPGQAPGEVRNACLEESVVLGVRRGALRASVHFYNSDEDVDRLLAVVRRLS